METLQELIEQIVFAADESLRDWQAKFDRVRAQPGTDSWDRSDIIPTLTNLRAIRDIARDIQKGEYHHVD